MLIRTWRPTEVRRLSCDGVLLQLPHPATHATHPKLCKDRSHETEPEETA